MATGPFATGPSATWHFATWHIRNMSYRLQLGESVADGVRRIATEQIARAIREIDDRNLDCFEAAQQVRKRCKKVRALARLVRPRFPAYGVENEALRDAARELTEARDAGACVETYDALVDAFDEEVDRAELAKIERGLTLRKRRLRGLDDALGRARSRLVETRRRAERWTLESEGFDVLRGGFESTYARGCAALVEAYEDADAYEATPERFHAWRKRAKDHWHHLRLLRDVWPGVVRARRDEAGALCGLLGDDHDLAVLAATLRQDPDAFGGERLVQLALALAEKRGAQLELRARGLGRRLYAEEPETLGSRMQSYWEAAHEAAQEARDRDPRLAERRAIAALADR